MVVVVFAPHTHTRKKKKKEVDGYFALFLFCFFVLDPTTSQHSFDRSIDRSIFFKNREIDLKVKKKTKERRRESPHKQHTNTTTTSSQVLDRRETPKDKEDARTKPPFREKNAEEKKREKKRQKEK